MNKNELVEAIALSTEITKTDVDRVSLKVFGTFEVRSRSERTGRNPRTGETLVIPASKVPAFKVSSALKKAVNK